MSEEGGEEPVLIDLALQGGGSHGAFTWGVLDRLLEEPRFHIAAISGTSAGAMNAAILASGWADGGADGARAALEKYWRAVSRAAGEEYRDRLLRLPPFLRADDEVPSAADLVDAFALTGFFLERHAFEPRGLPMSPARVRFIAAITRALPDVEAHPAST